MLLLCSIFSIGKAIIGYSYIEVISHYLYLPEQLTVHSFILLETLKFSCFFLVCQYYAKASLAFLANKKRWLLYLRLLVLIGMAITVIGGIILILNGILEK